MSLRTFSARRLPSSVLSTWPRSLRSFSLSPLRGVLHGACVQHPAELLPVVGFGQRFNAFGLALPLKLAAEGLKALHILTPL